MPLFTTSPWPHSHHDLIEHYQAQYDKQIATGEYQPFLYPWGTFGALVVIIYLLIPHQNRPWLRNCRFLAFAWIVGFAAYSTMYTRARGMAPAFGIGLISAWSVVWVGAILVCNDAQTDFMRIERMEGAFRGGENTSKEKYEATRTRNTQERHTQDQIDATNDAISNGCAGPRDRHGSFAWQPYPCSPMIERIDWVCDIFCNFRGAGWNWRTSALPPPPKWVQEQLHHNSGNVVPKTSYKIHAGQVKMHPTRVKLLKENTKTLVTGYLALDALKSVMMYDPYFWGIVDRPPPSYLRNMFTSSPVLTHVYRMILSMLAIKYALQTIFALAPLVFSGVLGPTRLGARAEPWIYPETWAPYSVVLDRGLSGWWSSWWHQTFRFAFEQPSRKFIDVCGMEKKGKIAKLLQLVVAFGLSGMLHASGSHTCAGNTRPLRGPMAFFLLQALGIFAELAFMQGLKLTGVQRAVPRWLMRTFTFIYVHIWFYHTAHLLCDDFARGGVWLFEPIPVSLIRGSGFGADKKDGWWCWSGQVVRWHKGDRWWRSGVAF
ncbi:Nn.00g067430.m01.CDS01 [Neocucurbitaria sp. VM-36]